MGWLGLSRGGEAARDYLTRLRYCLARLRIGGTQHGISVIFDATANRRSYATGRASRSRVFLKSSSTTHWELCIQRDPRASTVKRSRAKPSTFPASKLGTNRRNLALVVRGDRDDPEEAAQRIIDLLLTKGFAK